MAEKAPNPDFEAIVPTDAEYAGMVFEDAGELTINLADVKEMKFENVPKGTYLASIDDVQYGMSQNSGAPMFSMKFEIIDGQYAGRKLPAWLSFSPRALPGTRANISRIAPELIGQPFKPRQIANDGVLIGKKVRIVVAIEPYQGEPRSRIVGFKAAEAGAGDGFAA